MAERDTVYLVMSYSYDGDYVESVWRLRMDAERELARLNADVPHSGVGDSRGIESFELDIRDGKVESGNT